MANFFNLLLIVASIQHLGWSMVCNKTGIPATDWWCTNTLSAAQQALAPSVISAGTCYCALSKPGMTQQDAFNGCAAVGGFLTDIQNLPENVIVGGFLDALKTSPEMPSIKCGANAVPYNGACYVYHSDLKYEWAEAEAYCQKTYQGHLASIHNLADQKFLFNNLSKSCEGCTIYGFWVGSSNYGNPQKWLWSDNSTMDFVPQITLYKGWKPQPEDPVNQQCMIIVRPDGGWGDWFCNYKAPFACTYGGGTSIYPSWISLQKTLSGFHFNLGNNCPTTQLPFQAVTSTSAANTAVWFTSTSLWTPVPPTATTNMAVCRMDKNICGRKMCTGGCSTCTATNNNTCYLCS